MVMFQSLDRINLSLIVIEIHSSLYRHQRFNNKYLHGNTESLESPIWTFEGLKHFKRIYFKGYHMVAWKLAYWIFKS